MKKTKSGKNKERRKILTEKSSATIADSRESVKLNGSLKTQSTMGFRAAFSHWAAGQKERGRKVRIRSPPGW